MPKVPTLSITAIISTALAGVASTAASGSQRWNGHSGALTANANMNPPNSRFITAGHRGNNRAEVECARGERAALRGHHVEADHRGEHDEPAKEVVQQELNR